MVGLYNAESDELRFIHTEALRDHYEDHDLAGHCQLCGDPIAENDMSAVYVESLEGHPLGWYHEGCAAVAAEEVEFYELAGAQ